MNKIPSCLHSPISDKADQKSRLLYAVNGVAEILLTADERDFRNSLHNAMALVAQCLSIDRIYIWQNEIKDGHLQYIQHFEWLDSSAAKVKNVISREEFLYHETLPEWEIKLLEGRCVNGPLKSLSQTEQARLAPYAIQSILVIPVHLRGRFWGFVSFDDCHQERTFTEDEISILRSANLMMVTAMDRHETAAKMRESDEHMKLMFDATPLCCSLWDANFNLIDCNAKVVSFFGLKNKQEYLDRFFDLSPEYQPDGRNSTEKALEYIATAFRDGRTAFEWTHRMPDGTPVETEVTVARVRRGEEYIVVGYTRDLREHKKMMNSIEYKDALLHTVNDIAGILLESETDSFSANLQRCLAMIAESVGTDRMYIWENYEKDGLLYCSQRYEWSEGAKPQQGGEYAGDMLYSQVAPSWEEKLSNNQCINALVRNMSLMEQEQLVPQGVKSILVVPLFLYDRFWGFIGFDDCHRERIFTDTEESILRSASLLIGHALLRNEMTHRIHAAVEQAQAASNAKSAFLARMSHEIRTPMNVIAGMIELIFRERIPAAIREHVLSVKQASSNMLSLINDILDFSKIEAGSLEIASSEYSLTSLINNVIISIRMKVREKPVLFTANIDCDIPNRLIGDETRIRQILLNVLDNAVKYTSEGFVSLTVSGRIEEDSVVITADVTDSGIGIKEEDIDEVFGNFVRIDGEMHKTVQGTGLGLPITKSLCEAMGGTISVRSEYGVGSTFTITLPQTIKSYDEKFAYVSDPAAKPVLLYEPRSVYADSIVASLEDLGVHCTVVHSPKAFSEKLRQRDYPFVFVTSPLFESVERMIAELKQNTKLVLLMEFGESLPMRNIRTIAMPVHAASIANILDDREDNVFYTENGQDYVRFIAPSVNILVVDDLNTNLKVAQGLMLPYQMQIDICESGWDAINCIQQKRYDMIFMDHMMPGIDGIETVSRIRSLEDEGGYYQNVPIIALTANAVSGVKEMFLQSGMNDFLAKPIDVNKLHGLLEKWIPNEKKEKLERPQIKPPVDIQPVHIQIEGVNVKDGIVMAGGTIDGYINMLTMFYTDGADKIVKIRNCMEQNDIKLYTTYIHAMKSASANIGAWEISEIFKQLEMAGRKDDIVFIRENTEHFLERFEKLLSLIHEIITKNQGAPIKEKNPECIKDELLKLREALMNRDAGEIDDIMNTLKTMEWDQKIGDMFEDVSKNIIFINYHDAVVGIERLLGAF